MSGTTYSESDDATPSGHQWFRPQGFTFQECRICGALKRTPVENERTSCAPHLHRKKPLFTKALAPETTPDQRSRYPLLRFALASASRAFLASNS